MFSAMLTLLPVYFLLYFLCSLQMFQKCLHIDAIAFVMERYDACENLEAEGNTLLGIRGILRLFANYTDYV